MDVLKKYQNILVPLIVSIGVFFGLKQFHDSKQHELQTLHRRIAEGEKKIQLAEDINEEREHFLQRKKAFVSEDADAFLNRVAGYAGKVGVEVLSVRLVEDAGARSRRRQAASGSADDPVLNRYDVEMVVQGGFSNIQELVKSIDSEETFVAVTSMKLTSNERLDRNGVWKRASADKTVGGTIRIIGMAVNELGI